MKMKNMMTDVKIKHQNKDINHGLLDRKRQSLLSLSI
jgi:hypothetical protein